MKIFFSELLASMFFVILCGFCLLESRQVHLYPVVSGIGALVLFLSLYSHAKIHLNPILTIGFVSKGEMPLGDATSRILAQLMGAMIGVLLLSVVVPYESRAYPGYVMSQVFAVEFILSLLLVVVFFSTLGSSSASQGQKSLTLAISVAGVLIVTGYVASDFSGGIINPALLAALILMRVVPLEYALAYIVGQTLAAIIGVALTSIIIDRNCKSLE